MTTAIVTPTDGPLELRVSGLAFDASTGFHLPNGAIRAPDAAWVRRDRIGALDPDLLAGFTLELEGVWRGLGMAGE